MKKHIVFLALIVLAGCNTKGTPKPTPVNNDETKAVIAAKKLYDEKYGNSTVAQKQQVLKDGPCLSNEIMPDWVADIAHNPRQPLDNDPANQCEAYKQGKAHHFVELDDEGNYIRAF